MGFSEVCFRALFSVMVLPVHSFVTADHAASKRRLVGS